MSLTIAHTLSDLFLSAGMHFSPSALVSNTLNHTNSVDMNIQKKNLRRWFGFVTLLSVKHSHEMSARLLVACRNNKNAVLHKLNMNFVGPFFAVIRSVFVQCLDLPLRRFDGGICSHFRMSHSVVNFMTHMRLWTHFKCSPVLAKNECKTNLHRALEKGTKKCDFPNGEMFVVNLRLNK